MTSTGTETLIAIDWGTTNRRGYLLDRSGSVLDTRQDDRGILNLGAMDFEAALAAFVTDWRDSEQTEPPILMSGMIGSRQGWIEAPYVTCPVGRDDLIDDIIAVPEIPHCWVVPGISVTDRAGRHDVMRGEEVQIFGAVNLTGQTSATLCLPGTHSKWAQVENGRLVDFATAMTGEVFQVMCEHSILGALMEKHVHHDADAFHKGVEISGRDGGLLAHLFSARAEGLFGTLQDSAASSYLSGVLIGHEIRDLSSRCGAQSAEILLVGNADLTSLYGKAITQLGLRHRTVDGAAAAVCGLATLWSARRNP